MPVTHPRKIQTVRSRARVARRRKSAMRRSLSGCIPRILNANTPTFPAVIARPEVLKPPLASFPMDRLRSPRVQRCGTPGDTQSGGWSPLRAVPLAFLLLSPAPMSFFVDNPSLRFGQQMVSGFPWKLCNSRISGTASPGLRQFAFSSTMFFSSPCS